MHVALILAKSGSKGMPGKNLFTDLSGKSLLKKTIIDIQEADCFSEIYVSTNCDKIKQEAVLCGTEVIQRENELADNDRYVESVYHAIDHFTDKPLTCTLIQVVQPIREANLLQKMVNLHGGNVDSVVTVTPFQSSMDWIYLRDPASGQLQKTSKINYGGDIARRNDLYVIDNAVVSFSIESARRRHSLTPWPYLGENIVPVIQDRLNSHYEIDINVPDDAEWYEFIQTFPSWKKRRDA